MLTDFALVKQEHTNFTNGNTILTNLLRSKAEDDILRLARGDLAIGRLHREMCDPSELKEGGQDG